MKDDRHRKRPFYDREQELAQLVALLARPRSELVIVYGRRGVGKSRLLDEAVAGRAHVAYTATERVLPLQLEDMGTAINTFSPGSVVGRLRSTDELLELLGGLAKRERRRPLIVVLDELPYLASVDEGLASAIQRWWNEQKRAGTRNIKLFLAGSHVSWMQRQAFAQTSPLFSVRTANLQVLPLRYRDAARFYPRFRAADRVRAWAVWGGMPAYLEQLEPRRTFWSNLERTTLLPLARLFEEPDWLKHTDFRVDLLYASIVRVIAAGERRPSTIAAAVGRRSADEIVPYLDRLRDAGIVERVAPLVAAGEGPRQAARYVLADPFLAYWYRFVDPHRTALERGVREPLLRTLRSDEAAGLDKHVSERAFEEICRDFLFEALRERRLPRDLRFNRIGSWWATRERAEQDEADVVAFDDGRLVAIGECKWTRRAVDERAIAGLERVLRLASDQLRPAPSVYRILFSRGGFTAGLRDLARRPARRLLLFEPADLYP